MITATFLYAFVGFLVTTAILRDDTMRDDLPMVVLAFVAGIVWLPLLVACLVLVALNAALSIDRV